MNIAIFASGSGSNALKIIEYFSSNNKHAVELIISNKSDAGVLKHAEKHCIPSKIITKSELQNSEEVLDLLTTHTIDLIVLAGYLVLIPEYLVNAYPNAIVNIHPSLLPKYGGKGMHGMHVHTAVFNNKEQQSGLTIHYVNAEYDKGNPILQVATNVENCSTPEEIAAKVLKLEHKYFPLVVEDVANELASKK